jgi:hypothetical protein
MPTKVRAGDGSVAAKVFQLDSNLTGSAREDFRRQVGDSLERSLRAHKAETIAAAVDRKKSTVYRWAASPEDVPLALIPALAAFDPDPEFLSRIAGLLLAIHAQRALAHEAQGRTLQVFHEISPGRWAR